MIIAPDTKPERKALGCKVSLAMIYVAAMLKSKRSLSRQTSTIKYRRREIPASRVSDYSKLWRVRPDEACGCIAEHTSANISYDVVLFSLIYLTRQSVAVQREGASRLKK